jgi:transposase-like protein
LSQKSEKVETHTPHHRNDGYVACGPSQSGVVTVPSEQKPTCKRCKQSWSEAPYRELRRRVSEG